MTIERIPIDQLCSGLYVQLEVPWHLHPFLKSRFRVKSAKQVEAIRKLGLESVLIDRARSEPSVVPLPEPVAAATADETPAAPEPDDSETLWQDKAERIEQMRAFRKRFHACEARFERSAGAVRDLMRQIGSQPLAAVEQAELLIDEMASAFLDERELVLNLMNVKGQDEGLYYHSLNVTVLSMMLGADAGFSAAQLRALGLGAMFHDIGKTRIPGSVLLKQQPLTLAEQKLYALHPRYGRELLERLKALPQAALDVVERHHEHLDGTGYPAGLAADQIDPLSRVVAIVDCYDKLCNPRDPLEALAPAEALSRVFKRFKTRLDGSLLQRFVRMLGVYPPGTLVKLSDGGIGLVTSIEADDLLRPVILLHDPDVPRREAPMIRLRDYPELIIAGTLTPAKLDPAVYEWLRPQARVSYFYSPYGDDI